MEAWLGFHIGFWDYVTFLAISVIVVAGFCVAVFILGLPGRIAIARKHPEADAVYRWIGFLAVVPWIQALIWAFKPTTVIDIRDMPKERQRETDAMIARLDRLEGKAPSPPTPPAEPPAPARSTAFGAATAWGSICRATRFPNSSNRLLTSPKISTP